MRTLVIFLIIIGISMSRDRVTKVSPEYLVKNPYTIILLAKKQKSFSTEHHVKIKNAFKSGPDFTHNVHHYTVEEILCNEDLTRGKEGVIYGIKDSPKIIIGQHIKVRMADYNTKLESHRKYYLKKIRRSHDILRYENDIDITSVDQVIVFLEYNLEDKIYEYSVENAYDTTNKKEEILHLLEKSKR